MLVLFTLAHADKLQDGWRGRAYGDPSSIAEAPGADCDPNPEEGVRWRCRETVGSTPIVVAYMVSEDLFSSVMISANGYADCSALFGALSVAWVKFTPNEHASGSLPDGYWNLMRYKTEVIGSWHYNQFSGKCTATALSGPLQTIIESRRAEKAKAAAEAL